MGHEFEWDGLNRRKGERKLCNCIIISKKNVKVFTLTFQIIECQNTNWRHAYHPSYLFLHCERKHGVRESGDYRSQLLPMSITGEVTTTHSLQRVNALTTALCAPSHSGRVQDLNPGWDATHRSQLCISEFNYQDPHSHEHRPP